VRVLLSGRHLFDRLLVLLCFQLTQGSGDTPQVQEGVRNVEYEIRLHNLWQDRSRFEMNKLLPQNESLQDLWNLSSKGKNSTLETMEVKIVCPLEHQVSH